jgi:hypothetical protein
MGRGPAVGVAGATGGQAGRRAGVSLARGAVARCCGGSRKVVLAVAEAPAAARALLQQHTATAALTQEEVQLAAAP